MEDSNRILCGDAPCERARNCDVLLGIAHEVSNMLTAISGWAQFWEDNEGASAEDGSPARYLYIGVGRIRHSFDRLVVRVGGGLDHRCSAMANVHARAHREVNVNHVVEMTLAALDPRIAAGYTIENSSEPAPWPILADYWALDVVLTNLLMDAATASVPGSRLLVETANVATHAPVVGIDGTLAPGRYVTISVRGFAETVSEQRLPGAGQLVWPGGCAQGQRPICSTIVHEHGGLMQVLHETTGETTSVVYLPALAPRAEAEINSSHCGNHCVERRQ
jgi:hypothetical protein